MVQLRNKDNFECANDYRKFEIKTFLSACFQNFNKKITMIHELENVRSAICCSTNCF